ncbi:hypothetical protein GCM10027288_22840 [Bordetella tumbae]
MPGDLAWAALKATANTHANAMIVGAHLYVNVVLLEFIPHAVDSIAIGGIVINAGSGQSKGCSEEENSDD